MTKARPTPEQLLHRAEEEERQGYLGKLKIYLGAGPGVGKTHEMIHDAFEKRQQGYFTDMMIGCSNQQNKVMRMMQTMFSTNPVLSMSFILM